MSSHHVHRNFFDKRKNAVAIERPELGPVTGQEANFAESMVIHRISSLGDAVFKDGDRIVGCEISIAGGVAHVHAGQIYLRGMVRDIQAAEIPISLNDTVSLGVIVRTKKITVEEDPEALRFQLSGHPLNGKALSPYVQETPYWGLRSEMPQNTAREHFAFFPVYQIENGTVLDATPPPELSGVNKLIAQYDYRSNGHYVAEGFRASLLNSNVTDYEIGIEEGVAHVNGVPIDRQNAQRLSYSETPDLDTVRSEGHIFVDDGTGKCTLTLHRSPIFEIDRVTVVKKKTKTISHGNHTGAVDNLNEPTLAQILSIKQGDTTYSLDNDVLRIGDKLDWSPIGRPEPMPGSTYDVELLYFEEISPDSFNETTATVSGVFDGSTVLFDYKFKVPRTDLLLVNSKGEIIKVKGAAHPFSPRAPIPPSNQLALAEIHHDWINDPEIKNVAIQAITMEERENMRALAIQAHKEIAGLRLEMIADRNTPGVKSNIFTDNFDDNSKRDAGREQSLVIVNGFLTLPVHASINDDLLGDNTAWTLDYDYELVHEQTLETGGLKVNPFSATAPLLASVALTPAFDQWEEVQENWASAISRTLSDWVRTLGTGPRLLNRTVETQQSITVTGTTETRAARFLRQIEVRYEIKGFDANEALDQLTFDGVAVDLPTPAPQANAEGELAGTFTIPPNIPVGSKTVEFIGEQGSLARGSFTGSGTISVRTLRRVITSRRVITNTLGGNVITNWDPAGFFISFPRDMRMGRIEFKVHEVGDENRPILMEVRRVVSSQPTGEPIAEAEVSMVGKKKGDIIAFDLDPAPFISAFEEIAVVCLTDDDTHSLRIAELGKYDSVNGQHVTRQPNTQQVTIVSSNNNHFVPLHDQDHWVRIYEARPKEMVREIELGSISVENITDILPQAGIEEPAPGTRVELIIERDNAAPIVTRPGVPVSFSEMVTDELRFKARIVGTETVSSILFDTVQVILGQLQTSGVLTSLAFECGDNKLIDIVSVELTPGQSGFTPFVRDQNGALHEVPLVSETNVGDGWMQRNYQLANFSSPHIAVVWEGKSVGLERPVMACYTATPIGA